MARNPVHQSETELTRSIRRLLTNEGVFNFKHWGGPMSAKGVADIIGILKNGRFLAIEVKKPGWKPPKPGTKAHMHFERQYLFLKNIHQNGGVAFFASSIDDVIDHLGWRDRFII